MSRPRKKPDFDSALSMQELIEKVAASFGTPYDDRDSEDREHVSIRSVAKQHGITILKARKMLITAGFFYCRQLGSPETHRGREEHSGKFLFQTHYSFE